MKKLIIFVLVCFVLGAVLPYAAYAGWKENYRTKYSKQTVDPNSEKARKIRTLANFDFTYPKPKTAAEKKALGIEPKTTLTANLMPWKKNDDKFENYTQNYSSKEKALPAETRRTETGNTLTDLIRRAGREAVDKIDSSLVK